jgi:hypothetical protein
LIANAISIIRGRTPSYFVIGISVVIILSFFPIMWDVRNNFYRIFYFPDEGLNFYTLIISFLTINMSLSFSFVIAMFSVIIVSVYIFLLKNSITEIQKTKSSLYFFTILLLFSFLLEYRQLFDLQKTTLSIAFFIVAMEIKNIFFRCVFNVLSILFHPLMILLPILGLLSSIFTFKKFTYISIFLISFIFSFFMVEYIVSFISSYFAFSERIVNYILLDKSRFSSENIALFIRVLRLISISVIFIIFLKYLKVTKDIQFKKYTSLVLLLSIIAILLSFNEIALERFYLGLITITIFVSIKFKLIYKHIFIMGFFIAVNVFLHGLYTLNLIYSDNYDTYVSSAPKIQSVSKVFYYPTLFLLNHETFGQSNEYIEKYTNIR